jgi:hypothetical protein
VFVVVQVGYPECRAQADVSTSCFVFCAGLRSAAPTLWEYDDDPPEAVWEVNVQHPVVTPTCGSSKQSDDEALVRECRTIALSAADRLRGLLGEMKDKAQKEKEKIERARMERDRLLLEVRQQAEHDAPILQSMVKIADMVGNVLEAETETEKRFKRIKRIDKGR